MGEIKPVRERIAFTVDKHMRRAMMSAKTKIA